MKEDARGNENKRKKIKRGMKIKKRYEIMGKEMRVENKRKRENERREKKMRGKKINDK